MWLSSVRSQVYVLHRKRIRSYLETAIFKLMEKPGQVMAMNGILRLICTYLYHCQEVPSTTAAKPDIFMKHF